MRNRPRKNAPTGRRVLGPAGRSLIMTLPVLVLATAIGCSTWFSRDAASGFKMRPASDLARIQQNAYYYKLMGRPELALKELEEAHRRDPGNLKVADALAQCCEQLGWGDRARQVYREALARDPDNVALENNFAYSYYLAGDLRRAEDGFRQTLARHPDTVQARNNLGLVLCRQGRQEEARRLWEEAGGPAKAAEKLHQVMACLGTQLPAPARDTAPAAAASLPPASATPSAPAAAAETMPAFGPSRPGAASQAPKSPELDAAQAAAAPGPPGPAAAPPGYFHRVAAAPASSPAAGGTPQVIQDQASRLAAAAAPSAAAKPESPEAPAATPSPSHWKLAGGPLTCRELVKTTIDVRNGNGVPDLARATRSRLDLEGFNVVAIGNYLDFGMEKTIIYCRPGAERVARTLSHQFFRDAGIETSKKLADDIDIRVVLGHDFTPHYAETGDPAKQKAM